jgi:hypothetical protein
MSTMFRRVTLGGGSCATLVFAFLASAPCPASAQAVTVTASTTPNPALTAAKATVSQAQSEHTQAQLATLQGQVALVSAQTDAEKAKSTETAAEAKLVQATAAVPNLKSVLDTLNSSQPPQPAQPPAPANQAALDAYTKALTQWALDHARWTTARDTAQKGYDAATKSVTDAQSAVASAKTDATNKGTAASVAQGVYNQLQKNEQQAQSKVQTAIQSLLNQVSAAPAASTMKLASETAYPLLLATALTRMSLGPFGTPIEISQPSSVFMPFCGPDTKLTQLLSGVAPPCDPVPRVQVCSWVPRMIGATPIMNVSQHDPDQLALSNPGSMPSAPGEASPSQTQARPIPADENSLAANDPFSTEPSVSVVQLDQDDDGLDSPSSAQNETGTAKEKPYQLDYRFDLPARFSVGVSDSRGESNYSSASEGAVIHEGMRLLTSSDGRYQVRMIVTAPNTAVTMRLQLLLYDDTSKPFPSTITLPTIRLEMADDSNNDGYVDDTPPNGGPVFKPYLVRLKGYSHVVREREGKFLLAKRIGTARFGEGLTPMSSTGL